MTVPQEEAPANYLPAAAVIRRVQALPGFIGLKGAQAARHVRCEIARLNWAGSADTAELEQARGQWNSRCSGGMRRYREEHQWRWRLPGALLTLRRESVGSDPD